MEINKMNGFKDLNRFKDWLFETLNDFGSGIADIDANDRANTFRLTMIDGTVFEIECRRIE